MAPGCMPRISARLWFVALPSAIVLVAHGIELSGLVQLAGEIKSHDTPFVPSKFQRYCARWLGTLHNVNVHATNVTNLAGQMEDCDLFEAAWKRLDAQWLYNGSALLSRLDSSSRPSS